MSKLLREKLWQAISDGTITQVVSDHSPCTLELKLIEKGNYLEVTCQSYFTILTTYDRPGEELLPFS